MSPRSSNAGFKTIVIQYQAIYIEIKLKSRPARIPITQDTRGHISALSSANKHVHG